MSSKAKRKRKEKHDIMAPPFQLCESNTTFSEAFESVSQILQSCSQILVLAGAGISVSCGIPDFRSPQGLYATLDSKDLGLSCPEELFDLEYFHHDPRPFYKFAKSIYFPLGADNKVEPSDSHKFLALLEQQNKLLRVYTQNIDGLEEIAGVSSKRMVYAHGSLQWTQCCRCHRKVPASQILDSIKNGVVPLCNAPKNNVTKLKGKIRSSRQRKGIKSNPLCLPQLSTPFCQGVLKPGVTFFGEILNDNVSKCLEADRDKADALIVIGTSLSVAPISKIISYLPPRVPRLLINRTIVSPPNNLPHDIDDCKNGEKEFRKNYTFDAYLLGFCDDVTRALVNRMKHTTKFSNEGKLAANLKDDDPNFSLVDWNSTTLPRERLFLFPGAIVTGNDDDMTYTEIAHCDGCGSKINGTIRKCIECFDFDLCHLCYPDLSKSHFGGSHTFLVER